VPDFLVIGAQKCGTTWISHLLSQHPEIHVPRRKELHFFNHRHHVEMGLDWYRAQFRPREGERYTAEATPNYFWNLTLHGDRQGEVHRFDIAPQVRAQNPEVRLVLSLRDPVDRAVSAYYHYIATGQLDPRVPFREALAWYGTRTMGLYAQHYRHWLGSFECEQILTLIFERDIRQTANRPRSVERLFGHLGVAPPADLDMDTLKNARASYLAMQTGRYMPPRSLAGQAMRHLAGVLVPKAIDGRFKPPVTQEDREELRAYYRPHNEEMSELLGIDLREYWS
jgi:hypothetical protein